MYRQILVAAVVVAVSLSCSRCVTSQENKSGNAQEQKQGSNKNAADETFVKKASEINLAEINIGNHASQQSKHDDVKKYAQKLVKDHTEAQQELQKIIQKKQLSVGAVQMDEEHRKLLMKLVSMKGDEHDREYLHHMAKGHEKAAKLYEEHAQQGSDADLKAYASKYLPVVREHGEMAKKLLESHGNKKEGNKSDGDKKSESK